MGSAMGLDIMIHVNNFVIRMLLLMDSTVSLK